LLGRDPAVAAELRIGRPDLPRNFDDGGLIDVNTVPAQVLSRLLGLRPSTSSGFLPRASIRSVCTAWKTSS
jgi:hypothetical protein